MVKVKVHKFYGRKSDETRKDLETLANAVGKYFKQYILESNCKFAPWLWLENSTTASVACAASAAGMFPTVELPLINNRWIDLAIIGKNVELIFEAKYRENSRIFRGSSPIWHNYFYEGIAKTISAAKQQARRTSMLKLGRSHGLGKRSYAGVAIYSAPYVQAKRKNLYEKWYKSPAFLTSIELEEMSKSFPYGMAVVEICINPSLSESVSSTINKRKAFWPYCFVMFGLSARSHASTRPLKSKQKRKDKKRAR